MNILWMHATSHETVRPTSWYASVSVCISVCVLRKVCSCDFIYPKCSLKKSTPVMSGSAVLSLCLFATLSVVFHLRPRAEQSHRAARGLGTKKETIMSGDEDRSSSCLTDFVWQLFHLVTSLPNEFPHSCTLCFSCPKIPKHATSQ